MDIPDDWIEIPAETIEKLREDTRQRSIHGPPDYFNQGAIGQFTGIPVYHNEGRWYIEMPRQQGKLGMSYDWEKAEAAEARMYAHSRWGHRPKGTHATRPEAPTVGQVYVDLDTNSTHRFNGVQWVQILASRWPNLDIEEVPDDVSDEEALMSEEEKASRICIWCGKMQESVEALAIHEETCE